MACNDRLRTVTNLAELKSLINPKLGVIRQRKRLSFMKEASPYERGRTGQNRRCKEGMVGKAERQGWVQEGYASVQEINRPSSHDCNHA
jgi:hypothetical protein